MSFSTEWEAVYASGRQGSVWPWSDLVSYVMRYARPAKKPYRVLELGPAAGANVPFFKELDVEYYGIEGSKTAVQQLQKRFPEFSAHIVVGDFTADIPFGVAFDLVVDRASLTHNTTDSIVRSLTLIRKNLRPGGMFIGIDWFSTEHSDRAKGMAGEDANTRTNFTSGQFKGLGNVHFFDQEHIERLFKQFTITKLEHKKIFEEIPNVDHVFASWNLVAEKK